MEHPLKVIYPYGGQHYALYWWTYDERGHIAIARSERSLLRTAEAIFDKHPDAEIKQMLLIDIVAPSDRMCQEAVEASYKNKVFHFHSEITSRIKELLEKNIDIDSKFFAKCEVYQPDDPEYETEEYNKNYHYECKNCRNCIRLIGITPNELYDRFNVQWKELSESENLYVLKYRPTIFEKLEMYSRADKAQDDEILWAASPNFGHHSDGLYPVEITETKHLLNRLPTFYFRNLKELDQTTFYELLKTAKKKFKAHQNLMNKLQKERYDKEQQKRTETVRMFINLVDES